MGAQEATGMSGHDEQLLMNQVQGLRARRKEGWIIDRLDEAPLHVPGCDDVHNRFAWYVIKRPVDGGHAVEGYVHFPKDVEV